MALSRDDAARPGVDLFSDPPEGIGGWTVLALFVSFLAVVAIVVESEISGSRSSGGTRRPSAHAARGPPTVAPGVLARSAGDVRCRPHRGVPVGCPPGCIRGDLRQHDRRRPRWLGVAGRGDHRAVHLRAGRDRPGRRRGDGVDPAIDTARPGALPAGGRRRHSSRWSPSSSWCSPRRPGSTWSSGCSSRSDPSSRQSTRPTRAASSWSRRGDDRDLRLLDPDVHGQRADVRPQVVAFLGLTGYSSGLDGARDATRRRAGSADPDPDDAGRWPSAAPIVGVGRGLAIGSAAELARPAQSSPSSSRRSSSMPRWWASSWMTVTRTSSASSSGSGKSSSSGIRNRLILFGNGDEVRAPVGPRRALVEAVQRSSATEPGDLAAARRWRRPR